MGVMLIKSAFAYGRFGYGYSNQIFDERMEPSDAIAHSLFPRYAPPSGRTQEDGKVLRFRPIRPLDIFPFHEPDAHVGSPLLRLDRTEENEEDVAIRTALPWVNPSLQYIPALAKDKCREWGGKLNEIKSVTRRVAYLKEICTAAPTNQFTNYAARAEAEAKIHAPHESKLTESGLLLNREGSLPEVLEMWWEKMMSDSVVLYYCLDALKNSYPKREEKKRKEKKKTVD